MGRNTKTPGEKRDKEIKLRLSVNELDYIDKVSRYSKEKGSKKYSRSDILILGAKFIYGDITLLDDEINNTL